MIQKLLRFITRSDSSVAAPRRELDAAIAATALLFEVARVDMNVDEAELKQIQLTAQELFQLSDDTLPEFLAQSKNLAEKSTSYFEFTTVINDNWDEEQKYLLVKSLWSLAKADGILCKFEEHIIRRISDLLYVPHELFIKAKFESE